jgi:Lipid A core - O-antigen ligase and related enzymes
MLLVLMPFSLLMFFRYKNIFMKVFTLGLFACILIGFFHTFSRGGFIGLSALLMFSIFKFNLLQGSNKVKIVGYAMLVAIIGAVVFASVSETYIARIETLTTLGSTDAADSSLEKRFDLIKYAIKVFIDHPILGVGVRNFELFNPLEKPAHNMYLEVLTGTGLVGFIPFMAILFLSWRDLKKVQNFCKLAGRENSLLYQIAVAFELGFVGYLVAALFLSIEFEKMTWILITLSSVLWSISVKQSWAK